MNNNDANNQPKLNVWGKSILILLPLLLWVSSLALADALKDESTWQSVGAAFKVVALILLAFSWLTLWHGATERMPLFMLKADNDVLTDSDFGIPTKPSKNAKHALIVEPYSALHPSVIEVLTFMATVIPDGEFDTLSKEDQTIIEVGVYLQYQKVDQALKFLNELGHHSLKVKGLIARLEALKATEGTDAQSFELRKLKRINLRQRDEINFWKAASVRSRSVAGK